MGAASSATLPQSKSSQQIGISENPSLSIVSFDDTIDSVRNDTRNEVFSVISPIVSEKLIQSEGISSESISVNASIKLASLGGQKKKSCGCACCGRRKSDMNEIGSLESFGDDGEPIEVITIKTTSDMVINPTHAIPLNMVSSLEMTAAEARSQTKKKRRSEIPPKPDKPLSLWGLIKSAVGKDLTKTPLPVNFSEPLSMLQRLTEDYEYSSILDKASHMTDSLEQMASVAAFTISSYASCAHRTSKPFNPLLGETYECDRTDDLGWRTISEQVCHHPPIASIHCESAYGWVHWQQFTMKSNFRGTYLEIHPLGIAHLRFKKGGNHYTWRKVATIVRNLYMGKVYIEQQGEMEIFNYTTNDKCILTYTCGGMFSRDRSVIGTVYNKANEPIWGIHGAWDNEISATKLDANGKPSGESKILWKELPLPPDAEAHYNFSLFARELNEMEDGVAPTDSRNRPDQRFMENALWDEANLEKVRLEEKQREAGKIRVVEGAINYSTSSKLTTTMMKSSPPPTSPEDGIEPFYTPCWFTRQRDPLSGQYIYMYNGEYWKCKESQDWARCPNIFDK